MDLLAGRSPLIKRTVRKGLLGCVTTGSGFKIQPFLLETFPPSEMQTNDKVEADARGFC